MESVYDYERYEARNILPFAGGYRDQPAWVQEDFRMLGLWFELVKLTNRLTKASTVNGSMQDIVAGNINGR